MTSNDHYAGRDDAQPWLRHVPVSPALARATFHLDAELLSSASGYLTLARIKEALEAALAEWTRTEARRNGKRTAALRIAIENDLPAGTKAIERCFHYKWTEAHREEFGPPPSARTIRRWLSALRRGEHVPDRDYVKRPPSRRPAGTSEHKREGAETAACSTAFPSVDVSACAASLGLETRFLRTKPHYKTAIERRFLSDEVPLLPGRPDHRRRHAETAGPPVGGSVEVDGMRRYLGRTLDGGHAFAERIEDLAEGAKPTLEILRGEFTPDGFRRH